MNAHICPNSGWVRIHGYGLNLLGPSVAPLFSERTGLRRPLVRFKGWRLFVLRPPKETTFKEVPPGDRAQEEAK